MTKAYFLERVFHFGNNTGVLFRQAAAFWFKCKTSYNATYRKVQGLSDENNAEPSKTRAQVVDIL